MNYIAFDSHKRYTLARVEKSDGTLLKETRVEHERGAIREFLSTWEPGSPVAVETIGNWYWIVDEIEAAGMQPRLTHARKAKLMMGSINKTDKLDARGLNILQRNGTLPTVWVPPRDLRDERDLPRTRMMLTQTKVRLKNRIHAALARYALEVKGFSDAFGVGGRAVMRSRLELLPIHTRYTVGMLLDQLEGVEEQIGILEARMRETFKRTPELERLMSLPGIGFILGTLILLELGDVSRFPTAEKLACYAGTTPRVHASGGKIRIGPLRSDVNRYLKWAYVEAGNSICMNRRHYPGRHVVWLYDRVRLRKGHQKAIGAVARHLAEATYWMLTKREPYREPARDKISSTVTPTGA